MKKKVTRVLQANFHPGDPHKKALIELLCYWVPHITASGLSSAPRTFQRNVMLRILVLSKWFTSYLIFNAQMLYWTPVQIDLLALHRPIALAVTKNLKKWNEKNERSTPEWLQPVSCNTVPLLMPEEASQHSLRYHCPAGLSGELQIQTYVILNVWNQHRHATLFQPQVCHAYNVLPIGLDCDTEQTEIKWANSDKTLSKLR